MLVGLDLGKQDALIVGSVKVHLIDQAVKDMFKNEGWVG